MTNLYDLPQILPCCLMNTLTFLALKICESTYIPQTNQALFLVSKTTFQMSPS